MGELEEKLESVLSNPDAMAQIMSLARSLNAGKGAEGNAQTREAPPAEEAPSPPAAPAPGGSLLDGLGSLDPKLLSAAASLLSQYQNGDDDKRVALLSALRPFVRKERYAKLDKAIQIAKLSRVIRSALDLFRAAKEDGHV